MNKISLKCQKVSYLSLFSRLSMLYKFRWQLMREVILNIIIVPVIFPHLQCISIVYTVFCSPIFSWEFFKIIILFQCSQVGFLFFLFCFRRLGSSWFFFFGFVAPRHSVLSTFLISVTICSLIFFICPHVL